MLCEASSGNTYVGCCSYLIVSPKLEIMKVIDTTPISVLRNFGKGWRGRGGGAGEFQYCSISPTPGPWRELRSQCQSARGKDGVE